MAVAIIGTLTAIFAASIGIVQTDIKKVLAYSTISQLGYMFMACGVADYVGGIFHLMTHAFFKALLFLGAGSVIHGLGGEQDMRQHGRAAEISAVHLLCMTIGDVCHLRPAAIRRLLLEGPDSVVGVEQRQSHFVADWSDHRRHDVVLHVPAVVPDVLWQVSRTES